MSTDFRKGLRYEIDENKKQLSEELDAYRMHVSENMPGYILFMEALNELVTGLEAKKIIGKTQIKSRVKAAKSAVRNSREKELDDIFGFNIITQSERDKEILMLIIHNLFVRKYVQEKTYDKSNGYKAYHCVGAIKTKITGEEIEGLEEHILQSKTYKPKEVYRDLSSKEQMKLGKKEVLEQVYRYPILRAEIGENGQLNESLQSIFADALLFLDAYLLPNTEARTNMPIMEVQFKTDAVEQVATCGRAKHMNYKKIDPEKVKEKYKRRELIRGIDFPFRFYRNLHTGMMELESTNRTLISMWPFLEETIAEYKKTDKTPLASYDMYMTKVFPDLQPYVERISEREPVIPIKNTNADGVWAILKNRIINDNLSLPKYTKTDEKGEIKQWRSQNC